MANVSLHTDGDAVGHRRGDARTLEEHVGKWAARRILAGVPARRCVLPFLTGAPKAVECRLCSKIIYAGEGIACSVKKCPQMFHLNCVVKDTPNFTAQSFRCPQHGCVVCKQNMFFWRCGRCTVAAHTRCAPWPVTRLNDDQGSAICWRHPSDWLLQNKNADLTNNIEEVFCRLPLPYVNGDFNIDSTVRDFAGDVCRPPPYTSIRRNIYLIKKRRTGVRVDTGCTNCRADSTCKEDCECRSLSVSCSKNCRCSDLCTNRPFRKDKKIKIVKAMQFGWDAVASEPLQEGDFIIEYVGEVIDDATREKRLWDIRQRSDKTLYMCQISKDFTIDVTFKGNISRFLNHSYEPNCKLEKWLVDGETRVGIFASHSIEVGEPLTYDCRFLHGDKVKCRCEALNFQGYLGNQIKNPTQNALATAQGKLREYSPTEQGSSAPRLKSVTCLLPWTNCTEVSFNLRSKRNINQLCWADKRKRTSLMASPASMRTSEVFCQPPTPYANEEFNINPTIKEFPGAVYKPPPYTPIRCNVYVNNMEHVGVPAKAGCTNCSVDSSCNDDSLCSKYCRPVRRYKKKSFLHPLDLISEAIARTPHNASIGDKAQHVANVGEEQNNTDSSRGMFDFGKLGLDHELPQDLDRSLVVSVDDVNKQAQRSDEHVTERPLTRSKRGISKKHKVIAATLCIEETGSAHPDSRSAQASVNEQETNQGKNYSVSRC